jgi:hypothetical protein
MTRKKRETELSDDERFCLDAYLINSDGSTAYRLSHGGTGASETSIKVMAGRWLHTPQVKKYLEYRKALTSPTKDETQTMDFTNRDTLLGELSRLVVSTHNISERNQLLKNIADIVNMKKWDNKQDEEKIHFYLPLSCKRCKLYVDASEKKERQETAENSN